MHWMQTEEGLGIAYLTGDSVLKDTSEAKYWLEKTHEHGSSSAEDTYCNSLPSNKQKGCKL
ncbi:MAG: SEL1-like repeat protein [Candidatus Thioglobus autotrophicus]|jgi:TPR repeat protein|nr:SEL1-like repeat protein [Candidatus Thioglobus autotrophicus]